MFVPFVRITELFFALYLCIGSGSANIIPSGVYITFLHMVKL